MAIIKKIEKEYGDKLDEIDDEQHKKRGLRLIMGTCYMVTRRHKILAPLASYIIQNGSRFKYSHEFEYFYPGSFAQMADNVTDLMLKSHDCIDRRDLDKNHTSTNNHHTINNNETNNNDSSGGSSDENSTSTVETINNNESSSDRLSDNQESNKRKSSTKMFSLQN